MPDIQFIQNKNFEIRGVKVMFDFDLAALYQLQTKVLNQAVKRNIKRFPSDFMFQLTKEEFEILRSQNVTSSWGGQTLRAINDLSEDTHKEFDDIYIALSEMANNQQRINRPRNPIGFIKPEDDITQS